MKARKENLFEFLAIVLLFAVFTLSSVETKNAKGETSVHTMNIGNSTPSISALKLNNNNPITLTAGTTTLVYVSFTVSDNNGCSDVFASGGVTTTVYRTDKGTSCSLNYRDCYIQSTTTYSCVGTSTSAQATTTFSIYYFADATDASSSASSTSWTAYVIARDASSTTANATSTAVELNTLTAIELSSSSINYGVVSAGSNTSSTNQTAGIINVGNSSSSLQVYGEAMTSGSNTLATSSQHFSTSTFVYGGTEQLLSDVAATVSGWVTSKAGNLKWSTSSMHQIRSDHSGATNGEYIYISGGQDGSYVATTTVKFIKPDASGTLTNWQNGTALPQASMGHASAILNGYIYVAGGYVGTTSTSRTIFAPINATGSIGAWSSTIPLLTSSTQRMTLISSENYLYAMGFTPPYQGSTTVYFTSSTITGQLNPWATTTPLPTPLLGPAAFTKNGLIYVGGANYIGSIWASSTFYATLNSNGTIGSWQKTTPYPTRYDTVGGFEWAESNGFVYGMGYYDIQTEGFSYYTKILPDGTFGAWSPAANLPLGLRADVVVALNGHLYSLSGYASEYTAIRAKLPTQNTYWGMEVPAGSPTGTYTGTITLLPQWIQ